MKKHLELKFNKLNKVFSNAGIWFMLVLDTIFLWVLLGHGYSTAILVFTIIFFVAEVLLVLSILPKPIINLKANANIIFLVVFAPMPLIALIWGTMLGDLHLMFFALLCVGRFVTYLLSFVFSLIPRVGAIFSALGLVAFLLTLATVTFGLTSSNIDFTSRPAAYGYATVNGERAVALKKVYHGFRDDVEINKCYLGDVKIISYDAITSDTYIRNLTIDSSVKTIMKSAINSTQIKNLAIRASDVVLENNAVYLANAQKVLLTGETAKFSASSLALTTVGEIDINYSYSAEFGSESLYLAKGSTVNIRGEYPTFNDYFLVCKDFDNVKLNFSKQLIEVAAQDKKLEQYNNIIAPITDKGEHYLRFNTDYFGTDGHGEGEHIATRYYKGGSSIELPTLEIAGYKFVGWFNSDYTKQIKNDYLEINTILHAKTLKNYLIGYELSGGKVASGSFIYKRTIEDDMVELPILKKDGYTFDGWFDYNDKNFKFPINSVQKGEREDFYFVAGYSKNYNITLVANDATLSYEIPKFVTKKSGKVTLPDAKKEGYTFLGWYTNPNFSDSAPALAINPAYLDSDVTLYAKFKRVENNKP